MTQMFLINIVLSMAWIYFFGAFTFEDILVGFLAGYLLLAAYCIVSKQRYHLRLLRSIALFFYFHYELVTSSIKVLWDIITPGQGSKPGFIAMPLTSTTPLEIFFTANLISLTPGTLSIALSEDHKILYIHAMFIEDVDDTLASLKQFESIVLGAFR